MHCLDWCGCRFGVWAEGGACSGCELNPHNVRRELQTGPAHEDAADAAEHHWRFGQLNDWSWATRARPWEQPGY